MEELVTSKNVPRIEEGGKLRLKQYKVSLNGRVLHFEECSLNRRTKESLPKTK